jgi:predicted SAM-dependent methyltransferase
VIDLVRLLSRSRRETAPRLHLGSGTVALPGWLNVDNQPYPGVDRVLDVTKELPFRGVQYIFAEHFIEHLRYEDARVLLAECRHALRRDGVLRLSTPNLDWVWASHYRRELTPDLEVLACFGMNRAFRGWGHQFVWNEPTLTSALRDAGFRQMVRRGYGESEHEALRGIEHHEQNEDWEGHSHILIMEAALGSRLSAVGPAHPTEKEAPAQPRTDIPQPTTIPLHQTPYAEAMELLARLCREGTAVHVETPDLTWIWHTQYPAPTMDACLRVNRLFRESAFLYNFRALEATLLHAGYGQVTRVASVPGTLVVEAKGVGGVEPAYLPPARELYLRDVVVR